MSDFHDFMGRRSAILCIILLAMIAATCTWLDARMTTAVEIERNIIPATDLRSVRLYDVDAWYTLASRLIFTVEVIVFLLLPLSGFARVVFWATPTGDTPTRRRRLVDRIIAANVADIFHRGVAGPLSSLESRLEVNFTLPAVTATSAAGTEAAYRRADVLRVASELRADISELRDALRSQVRQISLAQPNDNSPSTQTRELAGRQSFLKVFDGVIAQHAVQENGRITSFADPNVDLSIQILPDSTACDHASRAQLAVAGPLVARVIDAVLENGIHEASGPQARERTVHVTAYIQHTRAWILIADAGGGLLNRSFTDLAQPGATQKADGMGLGLYTCWLLSELQICELLLTDRIGGGAIARVSFPLKPSAEK